MWYLGNREEHTVSLLRGHRDSKKKIILSRYPKLYLYGRYSDTGEVAGKAVYETCVHMGLIYLHISSSS